MDLKRVYQSPTLEQADQELSKFADKWRDTYPAVVRSWQQNWSKVIPMFSFVPEIRKAIYTTNAIESLNARFRRAVRHRGHFPNEQSALKVLYLVATQRRPNRENMTGKIHGWKQILNALTIHYGDRVVNHS